MNRRIINCLIIIIIFFIGVSLGTTGSKEPIVSDLENDEREVIDVSECNKGLATSLAKLGEEIIDSIVGFIFEMIGGGIKIVLGF